MTNLNQPENGLVGEVSIPAPASIPPGNIENLPLAVSLQTPVNIRPTGIQNWDYVDIWRTGLEYMPAEQRLYSAWSIHYTVTGEKHACISACPAANLAGGPFSGPWFVGPSDEPPIDAQLSDWLFSVPDSWAASHTSGKSLVVGRFRDGGLSGLGPTLYAFAPVGSTPPAANSTMGITTLLEYGTVLGTDNYHFPDAIDGYKHSDEWREALWLTTGGQSAVAVVGRKAHGDNWYGYHGEHMPHDWIIMDVPYNAFDETDPDGKGWRAHRLSPMIILYDPDDLADVADGRIDAHEPQPYAAVRLDESIFYTSEHEIFSAAYDASNRLLYITEFVREADGALVVHVFRVSSIATGLADRSAAIPEELSMINYPNPFHSATTINYRIPDNAEVTLKVFDVLGRNVATLVNGMEDPGERSVRFDARELQLGPGLYHYVLTAGGQAVQRNMLLLR
jgi:hypothetical protein